MYVLNIYNYSNFIESFVAAGGEHCVTAHTRLPTDPQVNYPRTIPKKTNLVLKLKILGLRIQFIKQTVSVEVALGIYQL